MDYLLLPIDFINRVYTINKNPFTSDHIKRGKKYAKECHCVIGTLLRDSQDSFEYAVETVETISEIFKTVDLFILENDSVDQTRKLWESYKPPKNVKVFLLSLDRINPRDRKLLKKKTLGHDVTADRIKKMVYLRNILLENIQTQSRKFPNSYVFMTDLDIQGKLDRGGILDTFYYFSKNRADAIGCNGMTHKVLYYDSYAFKDYRKVRVDPSVHVPVNQGLYPAISSFSGGVFYKYSAIENLKYKYREKHKKILCEHITFNKQIKRFFINTNMIYEIYSH